MFEKKYTIHEIEMAMAEATTKMVKELKEVTKEEETEDESITNSEIVSMILSFAMYGAKVLSCLKES